MAGRVGTLSLKMETEIPADDPLVVEVRRCAVALEKIAEKIDPTPTAAKWTVGAPISEDVQP